MKIIENNVASVTGYFTSDFVYSHEIFGEKFYLVDLECERLSGAKDIIPVMVSERLLDINKDYSDCVLEIKGQFRSCNKREGKKTHLQLSLFARDIEFLAGYVVSAESNTIYLDGYICKEPIYRETPLGREIADLLIAVNRPYGKSDYIPCICWGRNANFANGFTAGTRVSVSGRIQSRNYQKKLDDGTFETRTAYEVSVGKLEVIENEEDNN